MILVVVEDLLFRSKISSAANALGIQVTAARSVDAALERLRERRPALVILDLDSAATQPFDVLRRMGADPVLAEIPTLGFVSHVHADAIRQARSLGIGEVLARSAFAAQLPEILRRYDPESSAPSGG